jgi:hypothetical protein
VIYFWLNNRLSIPDRGSIFFLLTSVTSVFKIALGPILLCIQRAPEPEARDSAQSFDQLNNAALSFICTLHSDTISN